MTPEPFRIEPEFSPRIWGARSLVPLYPEKTGLTEPIGEAWVTGHECRVAAGPFAGQELRAAWREMPVAWRGTRLAAVEDFPILAKFIFPTDNLSIQVHPDDAYAQEHERAAGGRGKTEMWHAVSAKPGAKLLLGMKPGANKEKFRASLAARTPEDIFESWPVSAGDTFFVPAGTPHTVGPGMILCEVQEYSDLTYRVYDYGRVDALGKPRKLHVEKALEVMNFGAFAGGKIAALPLSCREGTRHLLAACRYFAAERWDFAAPMDVETDAEHFEVIVILRGSGEMSWTGGAASYLPGQSWFVPAALGRYRIVPRETTALLFTYVPNVAALRKKLLEGGTDEAAVSRVVFA